MKIFNKIVSRIFLTLAGLSLLAVAGCTGVETTGTSTPAGTTPAATTPSATMSSPAVTKTSPAPGQQELQQVLTNALAAVKNIDTYRFVVNMTMKMAITGGNDAGNINIASIIGGDVKQAAHEMSMVMDTALDLNTKIAGAVSQNMTIQMYMLADTVYMNLEIQPFGKQWIKMAVSDELKKAYDLNAVEQQLAPLELYKDVKFLRYETFDGSECYVLSVAPDMQKILSWVGKDLPAGLNETNLDAVSKMFKSVSYTLWIAKDTGYIRNLDASMRLELTPDQFNTGEIVDFSSLVSDITMNLKMFDYNKAITVTLPPEASQAMEFPGTVNQN
jgi:hypothetical protein